MGAVKDFMIGVQELIYTALKNGVTDPDSVYNYVRYYEPRCDRATVEAIMIDMLRDD